MKVLDHNNYEIIGQTLDDAAGEAFDKAAKIMGLAYPGGPLIDKFAQLGDSNKFKFSKPKMPAFDYSFSGLKTGILYFLQKETKANPNFIQENRNDLCASIQKTIIEILFEKLDLAVKATGINRIAIAGGVSANSELRSTLQKREDSHAWKTFIPKFEFCTDNGAMIAISGYYKYLNKDFSNMAAKAKARTPINS